MPCGWNSKPRFEVRFNNCGFFLFKSNKNIFPCSGFSSNVAHLLSDDMKAKPPEDIVISPDDLIEYRINGTGAMIYNYGCK